jgi:hypothetical protein
MHLVGWFSWMDIFLWNSVRVKTRNIGNCNVTVQINLKTKYRTCVRVRVCVCVCVCVCARARVCVEKEFASSTWYWSALNRSGDLVLPRMTYLYTCYLYSFLKFIINVQIITLWFDLRFFFFFFGPTRAMTSSLLRFLDHTQWRTTGGRTSLDE